MTPALRWAATRAILMFHNCEGRSHKTVSTDHNVWRERRAEADSNRGPSAYQLNALPLGQTGSLGPKLTVAQAFVKRTSQMLPGVLYECVYRSYLTVGHVTHFSLLFVYVRIMYVNIEMLLLLSGCQNRRFKRIIIILNLCELRALLCWHLYIV